MFVHVCEYVGDNLGHSHAASCFANLNMIMYTQSTPDGDGARLIDSVTSEAVPAGGRTASPTNAVEVSPRHSIKPSDRYFQDTKRDMEHTARNPISQAHVALVALMLIFRHLY